MNATDMATLTASIERSLRNCSLNPAGNARPGGYGRSSSSADSNHHRYHPSLTSFNSSSSSSSDTATLVELNSHISLPYNWEQCLDLKTGEVYYVNWTSGKKAKEDPRLTANTTTGTKAYSQGSNPYCSDEEDDDNDEDSYDSEGSSTGYSSLSSVENYRVVGKSQNPDDVLVVAGCKRCLMYYMVPKHVEDCPKCTGQLLQFDRSDENAYASP